MPRKQKLLILKPSSPPGATARSSSEADWFLDSVARTLQNFGFCQIVPSGIEEAELYLKSERLKSNFGRQFLPVSTTPASSPAGEGLLLSPTHRFGVLRRYLKRRREQEPYVAKWFYIAPVWDLSSGKKELLHELGVFVLGDDSALANAQLINTTIQVLQRLGIKPILTEINSLGCEICQKDYQSVLQDYLGKTNGLNLCPTCLANLSDSPLEVFSCPNGSCQEFLLTAPQVVDFLDGPCRGTLIGVLECLDELEISYLLNPGLISKLSPQKVLFEITSLDQKDSLGEGGNYTSWAQDLGGEAGVPLLGFLTFLEKLWPQVSQTPAKAFVESTEVFMIPLGEVAARRALFLYGELQAAGIRTAEAMLGNSSIKNQLKEAQEHRTEIALIIGQKEALDETVILRDMRSGMQEVLAAERIIEEVKKRLGK